MRLKKLCITGTLAAWGLLAMRGAELPPPAEWKTTYLANVERDASGLKGTTIWSQGKKSPFIQIQGVQVDPDKNFLAFEMASSGNGQGMLNYRFGPGDDLNRHYFTFPVHGGPEFRKYFLPLKDNGKKEKITMLRLLPVTADGARIQIRNLRIAGQREVVRYGSENLGDLSLWRFADVRNVRMDGGTLEGTTFCVKGKISPFLISEELALDSSGKALFFEMSSSKAGKGALFYKFGEKTSFEASSTPFHVPGDGEFHSYSFPLRDSPDGGPLSCFRIAPIYEDGAFIRIRGLRLIDKKDIVSRNTAELGDLSRWSPKDILNPELKNGVFSGTAVFEKGNRISSLKSPEIALNSKGKMLVMELAADIPCKGSFVYEFRHDPISWLNYNEFEVKGGNQFHTCFLPLKDGRSEIVGMRIGPARQDGVKFKIRNLRIADTADKPGLLEQSWHELLREGKVSYLGFSAVTYLDDPSRKSSGKSVFFPAGHKSVYHSPRGLFNFPSATGDHSLTLEYQTRQDAVLEFKIEFFDPFGKKTGERKTHMTLNASENGTAEEKFNVQENVSEFIVHLETAKTPADDIRMVRGRIDPVIGPDDSLRPHFSKFLWLPQPQWNSWLCYFRKTFDLKKKPISAILQVTADNAINEVYVNGVRFPVGPNRTNRASMDRYEVAPCLKEGKNVVAILAADFGGGRGMIGDLALFTPGEPFRIIRTDESFRCAPASMTAKDWMTPDFDDSKWLNAVDQQILSLQPKEMDYTWFHEKEFLSNCKVSAKLESKQIHFNFEFIPPCGELKIEPRLHGPNEHVFPSFTLKNLEPGKVNRITRNYPVPDILDGGEYTFEIYMPRAAAPLETLRCKLRIPPSGKKDFPAVKLVYGNHRVPLLSLNGKAPENSLFHCWEHECLINDMIVRNSLKAGIHAYWIGGHALRQPDGSYDNRSFDRICREVLQRDPKAKIVLQVMVGSSPWENFSLKELVKQHPEECVCNEKGEIDLRLYEESGMKMQALSWASDIWQEEACRIMRSVIEYVRNKPYAGNIIGFQPMAGLGFEWKYYGGHSRLFVDYSKPARQKFAAYVLKKYGSLAEVEKVYHEPLKSMADIRVPSPEERDRVENNCEIIDPATRQRLIDYREFFSDLAASTLDRLCGVVKKETGGKLLAGSYYGYVVSGTGAMWNESGHYALKKLLNSPNIDFLVTLVTYDNRKPGEESGSSHPVASFKIHNKASILQTDFRTHHAGLGNATSASNIRESCEILKREIAWNLVEGAVFEYGFFGTGWIACDARQMAVLGKGETLNYRLAGAKAAPFRNRAALIIDEDSVNHTIQKTALFRMFVKEIKNELPHTGFGYDIFLAESLEQIPDDYRFYIFANNYLITPEQKRGLEKRFKKNGNTLLFLHAPGITNGKELSLNQVSDTVSLKLEPAGTKNNGRARIVGGNSVTASLFRPGEIIGEYRNAPKFGLVPREGEVLAVMEKDGEPAWVMKQFPEWRLFYSMLPPNVKMLKAMGKAAGLHIYNENTQDSTKGAGSLFAVHTLKGGTRKFSVPGSCTQAEELFTGTRYPLKEGKFTMDVQPESTYLFLGY